MNRADFMDQLESLLQSIAPTEREEAIQYYNDYFDDAGKENEQAVIEALGNPARVAENIKRDLLGNGYGDKPVRKAQASDRALMEYGKEDQDGDGDSGQESVSDEADSSGEETGSVSSVYGQSGGNTATGYGQSGGNASAGYGQGSGSTATGYGQGSGSAATGYGQNGGSTATGYGQGSGSAATGYGQSGGNASAGYGQGSGSAATSYGQGSGSTATGYGQESGSAEKDSARQTWSSFGGYGSSGQDYAAGEDKYKWSHDTAGWSQDVPEKPQKKMPVWAIALLVTVLVLASPVLAGLIVGVFGLVVGALAGWFGMIFGAGVAAVCLLLTFLVLVVTGVICCFTNPWVGMAMVGGGLICGCIGILFLMLTVAMAGIATPAIFRGIAWIFRAVSGKRRRAANA